MDASALFAQQGTVVDPGLWDQFGPFAIVFLLMAAAILELRAQNKALHAELAEVRKQMIDNVIPTATLMVEALRTAADRKDGHQ